jgi:lipopolysaccharide transport system permease protein
MPAPQLFSNFADLYRYRALARALVSRHLSLRYRGSALGLLWSLLNPLCLMLVYTLVFRYYMRFGDQNYALYLLCGLLPWIWFSSCLGEGVVSIVGSGHLITKSLFPAQVLPAVSVLTSLINYLLSLPLLFIFMWASGMTLPLTALALPLLILLQAALLYGLVLGLSALNVAFRDVQHLLGNVISLLFFLCPIVYPAHTVPEAFRATLELNPFALLTIFYHNLLLEGRWPAGWQIGYLMAWSALFLVVGSLIFGRWRERFAEYL